MLQEESVKDLTIINDVKFLGLYLNGHLSWNKHLNKLVLNLKKYIFLMRTEILVNYCDLRGI